MRKYNIPIFVPHKGCPFDCVFCNQKRITGQTAPVTADTVTDTIEQYLSTIPEREDISIETAFFGGSFTGIPIEEQSSLMERVQPYIKSGRIAGIRLSTRPDYIDAEILDNLRRYHVTTIELGVQSMVEKVLKKSNRGHSPEQVIRAAELIKSFGFDLGLQMMTGLPGDTPQHSIYTAQRLIELGPCCVRIYPTLTIRDTALEFMYKSGEYVPQSLEAAVELSKELLLMFETAGIKVIRIGLQPTEEINSDASVVDGPFHSAFGELVESAVYYDIAAGQLEHLPQGTRKAILRVNPREVSKMSGNKRCNIIKIKEKYNIDIKIQADNSLKKREVGCVCC